MLKHDSKNRLKSAVNAIDHPSRSIDDSLRAAIRTHLQDLYKSAKADVRGGFVTLSGSVRSFRQKELLHRFVMSLRGVKAVKDAIRVDPVESIADKQIAQHIRAALDAHAELPCGTAVIRVADGVATLNGNVRSAEERFLAENIASHCRGVTGVINLLSVDPLEEISDEAAARAVKGALVYCDDFETDGVSVSCADGRVCLRGEVPTMLDKALCEQLARLQAGVRSVENMIVVNVSS
ncbi:MAG TPA: BON domain-containing protein [Planctomycetota bacterium]|nr:BON domain-containing protein [Planctomycetota bacterium]